MRVYGPHLWLTSFIGMVFRSGLKPGYMQAERHFLDVDAEAGVRAALGASRLRCLASLNWFDAVLPSSVPC